MFALGVVIAAAALVLALVGTIAAYLSYCAKHPSHKFRAEVTVVALALVSSLAVRMAVGYASLPAEAVQGGITSFFHGLFSAAAGLTFNSLLELGDVTGGITACFYYGIIVYASLVFLAVISVGLSYETYSRVQMRGLRRRFCVYYIFTAITPDTILFAQSIKNHFEEEDGKKGKKSKHRYVIIFFENGEESFSRKNRLHRKLMENGFYYYSDFRRDDKGEVISFLKKFKFRRKDCRRDDLGDMRNKLFNVFAMGDCGTFEGDNGEAVFEDLNSVLKSYVHGADGKFVNDIPTTVNYYLLTGGEINFESYEHRLNNVFGACLDRADIKTALDKMCAGADEEEKIKIRKDCLKTLKEKIQVNVFNEATLSSQSLIGARKRNLAEKGAGAFAADAAPDENGAYRIAVLGFGKTGQYAMEELYVHTAQLDEKFVPNRFIADIYDVTVKDKSGLFAYNHPFFRCLNESSGAPADTRAVVKRADEMCGEAFDLLYSRAKKFFKTDKSAKEFVDTNMQLPVAVFHGQSCFEFPFMSSDSASAAVNEVRRTGIRDFVVALGDDEKDIAMANALIDSFKCAYFAGGKDKPDGHITVYVNLIEEDSKDRLNWHADDIKIFSGGYGTDGKAQKPYLSVVPFGSRQEMFSYDTLIDDYCARLYDFGYSVLSGYEEGVSGEQFVAELKNDYDSYRANEAVSDGWLLKTPFVKLSNKSAQAFSVNYYESYMQCGGNVSPKERELMRRTEHERWNRFHISHGWIYAPYAKEEKDARRAMRQHDCLCPFDKILNDDTKKYDEINVELGFIKNIVFGGNDLSGVK